MKRLIKCNNYKFTKILLAIKYAKLKKIENFDKNSYEYELINGIVELVDNNNTNIITNLIEEIRSSDKDCLYSGKVYRKYFFNDKELTDLEVFDSEQGAAHKKQDIINKCKNLINIGTPQSCTKSLNAIDNFLSFYYDYPLIVTISFDTNDGLDIMKLVDKYLNILNNLENDSETQKFIEDLKMIKSEYSKEQEIFTEVPNDYKIIQIGNIGLNDLPDIIPIRSIIKNVNFYL